MTTVRIFFSGERVGSQLKRSADKNKIKILAAARATAQEAAKMIKVRGDADIKSAGNFGSRWTDGFQATVTEGGGFIRISVTEKVPYWRVFQDGKVIHGKPLLWIPLSFAADAQGIRARDYPGRLFRVDRKSGGAPLLLAPGNPAQPKYFGKPFVTIPKKFHLVEIVRDVAKQLGKIYAKNIGKK